MEKFDIYKDIAKRTNGDIFIGVVGPVRTGKSTFITKVMQNLVIPNISNKLQKQIATDEMPQSADGKMIMTTQPRFIPANAVKIQLKNKSTANVRLVDCVGYMVEGALGHQEDGKARLVKTPWDNNEIPFENAAEIGTRKVVEEYSTIGVVVTTDGSFGELKRESYIQPETKTINELKKLSKPFIIVLNSKNPTEQKTIELANSLENKHGVPVVCVNVLEMEIEEIGMILERVLMQFPMVSVNVKMPKWMQVLPAENSIINEVIQKVKQCSLGIKKMCDFAEINNVFSDSENISEIRLNELRLGEGVSEYEIVPKEGLFYSVLSNECDNQINDDYELMRYIKSFAEQKKKFVKIKTALEDAEQSGYGVVLPTIDEMNLEEPVLVKQGGKYGVKLKASAPSLHIIKVDVNTEVSPIVGTEKQGEDLVNFIMNKFEDNPAGIWETNMFGKSLHDLVNEGLSGKLTAMPKDAQGKMRKTLTRIVNENKGGVLCILL